MISDLYKRVNYISGLKFLFSAFIREYDISKANITILYTKGVLTQDQYELLKKCPREKRQITVGLLQQKDSKVTAVLQQGIIEAKKMLFEANDIQDTDILCIKNDAVFVVNKVLKTTKFGIIEFVEKNVFTDFMELGGIEIYYGANRANNVENIQVKGLGKNKFLHDEFMIDFIVYMISEMDSGDISQAVSSFTDFWNSYISRSLHIGYYREFNSDSRYSIMNSPYKVFHADNNDYNKTKVININYNLNILRQLYGYVSERFFINNKF